MPWSGVRGMYRSGRFRAVLRIHVAGRLADAITTGPLARQYYGRPPLRDVLLLPGGAQVPAASTWIGIARRSFSGQAYRPARSVCPAQPVGADAWRRVTLVQLPLLCLVNVGAALGHRAEDVGVGVVGGQQQRPVDAGAALAPGGIAQECCP